MEMKKEIPGNETKENNGSNTYYFSSAKYPGETVSVHYEAAFKSLGNMTRF